MKQILFPVVICKLLLTEGFKFKIGPNKGTSSNFYSILTDSSPFSPVRCHSRRHKTIIKCHQDWGARRSPLAQLWTFFYIAVANCQHKMLCVKQLKNRWRAQPLPLQNRNYESTAGAGVAKVLWGSSILDVKTYGTGPVLASTAWR